MDEKYPVIANGNYTINKWACPCLLNPKPVQNFTKDLFVGILGAYIWRLSMTLSGEQGWADKIERGVSAQTKHI